MSRPVGVGAPADAARLGTPDALIVAAGFIASVLYLGAFPHTFGGADEAVYLNVAKRVLDGEVLYRDVFELTTPGWPYLLALLYRIFGVDIGTAKAAVAVIHGGIVAGVVLVCRRLGVRRSLAWLPAFLHLLVAQPAWPIASQHWLTALLTVALLLVCLAEIGPGARALAAGTVVGLLIAVHQRCMILGGGVALWLVIDHLVAVRNRGAVLPITGTLARFAAGVLGIVLPLAVIILATAGVDAAWRALVLFPLVEYRRQNRSAWGHVGWAATHLAWQTFPALLRYLPVGLIPALAGVVRSPSDARASRRWLLVVLGGASILSIGYYPDFIHIAFISPVLFVALTDAAESAMRRLPAWRGVHGLVWMASAAVAVAGSVRLAHTLGTERRRFPVIHQTAFGRVALSGPESGALLDRLDALLRDVPGREIYCYPFLSEFYLMLDAHNPTRFEYFLPGLNNPDQVQEVIDTLRTKRVPYVLPSIFFARRDDPVREFLRERYEPLNDGTTFGSLILRRRDLGGSAPPPAAPRASAESIPAPQLRTYPAPTAGPPR